MIYTPNTDPERTTMTTTAPNIAEIYRQLFPACTWTHLAQLEKYEAELLNGEQFIRAARSEAGERYGELDRLTPRHKSALYAGLSTLAKMGDQGAAMAEIIGQPSGLTSRRTVTRKMYERVTEAIVDGFVDQIGLYMGSTLREATGAWEPRVIVFAYALIDSLTESHNGYPWMLQAVATRYKISLPKAAK
jgi:hypothetical protein